MQGIIEQAHVHKQEESFYFITDWSKMDVLINEMWEKYCGPQNAKKEQKTEAVQANN